MSKKGIILAGGNGSRLYPTTQSISKHSLPIYDKPMIYYPLTTLLLAGVRQILIITSPNEVKTFKALLKDGSQWGIEISYDVQEKPDGIASAIIIAENFIKKESFFLILGDNIFYGNNLINILQSAINNKKGASIFGYNVLNPKRYGIVETNKKGKPIKLTEKPKKTLSTLAITGLYYYDNKAIGYAKKLKKSARGEYEITDLNKCYLKNNNLNLEIMGRGFAWFDAGTPKSLLNAKQFISVIQDRQNFKIACPEEIVYSKNYINKKQLKKIINFYGESEYGKYLKMVVK